jgi:serine/threonine protein phosphatase PrpC
MAENQTTLQLGADRLERFSLKDESSDNLTLIGYSVMLKPSYLAEIEFMR